MSKKKHIDEVFRDIVENHEAKCDSSCWLEMQTMLKNAGLQAQPSAVELLLKYFFRVLPFALIFGSVVIPTSQTISGKIVLPTVSDKKVSEMLSQSNQKFSSLFESQPQKADTKSLTLLADRQQSNVTNIQDIPASENRLTVENTKILKDSDTTVIKNRAYSKDLILSSVAVQNPESEKPIAFVEANVDTNASREIDDAKYQNNLSNSSLISIASVQVKKNKRASDNMFDVQFPVWKLDEQIQNILIGQKNKLTDSLKVVKDSVLVAENKDSLYPIRNLHFGLIYPLSSNGKAAKNYANRLSLHGIASLSAGVKGFEASSFGNVTSDYMQGTQFAGFFNLTGKDVSGVQVAGFFNFTGYRKLLTDTLCNQIPDKSRFALQAAGFANIDFGNSYDVQMAGFMNVARNIDGVQASCFVNVAKEVKGVQIAGFVNVAQKVKGVQIGILNVADEVDGVSIGLLNLVKKNRYKYWEFWGGETFHTNIGFKLGTRKFYNLFAMGTQYSGNKIRWGLGYGFGTELNLTERNYFNIELLSYHVNESEKFTKTLNLLNQFKFNFTRNLGKGLMLTAGPSWNVLVSDFKNDNSSIGSKIAPYTLFDESLGFTNLKMWLGFNVGIRF